MTFASGLEPINTYEDIIDSRDVIARIEHLSDPDCHEDGLTEEETAELAALQVFAAEGEALENWNYGVTLIRDSYFTEYTQEYADDVVEGMRDATWPFNHIDWNAAAANLRQDYTAITLPEWDGWAGAPTRYWGR